MSVFNEVICIKETFNTVAMERYRNEELDDFYRNLICAVRMVIHETYACIQAHASRPSCIVS